MREDGDTMRSWQGEELLKLYYTHPDAMDNSPRMKQHDNLHRQISSFQKLLQHAMSRFSNKKLYNMLKLAAKQQPGNKSTDKTRITSFRELRSVLDNVGGNVSGKGLQKEDDIQLQKYFNTYFDDIKYLKELKKHFDERIYMCLFDYFYDPTEDTEKKLRMRESFSDEEGDIADIEDDMLDDSVMEDVELDNLSEQDKLRHAVKYMYRVNKQWHRLLKEEDIDKSLFDPDSHHEILQFSDFERFENILRFVPDLFVKAYKSVEIAKQWWKQANKVYDELPGSRASKHHEDGFQKKIRQLEDRLARLAADIIELENRISEEEEDLEHLRVRECRSASLEDNCGAAEKRKYELDKKYNRILKQKENLEDELQTRDDMGSRVYSQMENKMRETKRQLMLVEHEMSLLTYNMKILKEDFNIEVEVRPEMVRYMTAVEENIVTLMEALKEKKIAKNLGERQLDVLKLNCERMRDVMEHVEPVQDLEEDESTLSVEESVALESLAGSDCSNSSNNNNNMRNAQGRTKGNDKHSVDDQEDEKRPESQIFIQRNPSKASMTKSNSNFKNNRSKPVGIQSSSSLYSVPGTSSSDRYQSDSSDANYKTGKSGAKSKIPRPLRQ